MVRERSGKLTLYRLRYYHRAIIVAPGEVLVQHTRYQAGIARRQTRVRGKSGVSRESVRMQHQHPVNGPWVGELAHARAGHSGRTVVRDQVLLRRCSRIDLSCDVADSREANA